MECKIAFVYILFFTLFVLQLAHLILNVSYINLQLDVLTGDTLTIESDKYPAFFAGPALMCAFELWIMLTLIYCVWIYYQRKMDSFRSQLITILLPLMCWLTTVLIWLSSDQPKHDNLKEIKLDYDSNLKENPKFCDSSTEQGNWCGYVYCYFILSRFSLALFVVQSVIFIAAEITDFQILYDQYSKMVKSQNQQNTELSRIN